MLVIKNFGNLGFIGLRSIVDKSDMIRAIIEALNYQFRQMVDVMENSQIVEFDKIISVGGATHSSFWMQNKADITGKTIEVPDVYEATPLGAAMLAGIGIGLYCDYNDAFNHIYKKGKIYKPNSKLFYLYDEYYKIYKKIYNSLKDINFEIFNKFIF